MSTRSRARATAVAAFAIAVVVAACSSSVPTASPAATPPQPTPSSVPSPAPSGAPAAELVLRVATEGGFIGPAAHLGQLPEVVVYADGRIFTPAPVPAIYPGPLVPVESVRNVGATGVASIRAAITAAGLDTGGGTSPAIVPDAPDTVFAVRVGVQTVTTRFQALGIGGPGGPVGPGASSDPRRTAALALLTRLTDPTDTWGGPASDATEYVPTAYRIFVAPGAPVSSDPATAQHPVAWPLATPLASFGRPAQPDRGISSLRVGVVSGADAAALAPVLARATQITPFTSGGASYTLYVTPLLPDEAAG